MWWISALLAGAGLLAGGISANDQINKGLSDADYKIADYKEQEKEAIDLMDLEWDNQVDQATKEADRMDRNAARTDMAATQQEGIASAGVNNALDQVKAGQEGEALSWNIYAQQMGQETGNAMSSMAASGLRSSTMAQAVDMQAATNSAQLQQQENQQRATDKAGINSALNTLANANNTLQSQRYQALDLRNDAADLRTGYGEGGQYYNIFQQRRNNAINSYNRAINEITREKEYAQKNKWKNILTGMFTGGNSGLTFGTKLQNYFENL